MNAHPFGDKKLEFPIECHYKIIVEGEPADVKAKLEETLKSLEIETPLREGSQSSAGRYVTFNLMVVVESADRMRLIDEKLRSVPGVKIVL